MESNHDNTVVVLLTRWHITVILTCLLGGDTWCLVTVKPQVWSILYW